MAINGIEDSHDFCVSIPWDDEHLQIVDMVHHRETKWLEASTWAMERFGLPGERYSCRMCQTKIEFWFGTEYDAMIFRLRWA